MEKLTKNLSMALPLIAIIFGANAQDKVSYETLDPSKYASAHKVTMTEQEYQTAAIIDLQLAAYNARDIQAFAATYHDDVEIHSFSDGLLYQGKDKLIEVYGPKFASLTFLKATSLKRIINGRFLVDHELAESSNLENKAITRSVTVIAAYEVVDGLIKRVTFMK